MNPNSKIVVVTGGCGYIGSHIAKELKKNNYRVIIVDRVKRLHTLKFADEFIQADYDSTQTNNMLVHEQPDAIIHCAGTSLVGPSVKHPAEYYENNVVKTIHFLSAIDSLPKKPVVVFSSSAAVYGSPTRMPISENEHINPMSPYGRTKVIIETVLSDYSSAYGLKYIALRYFNACGADLDGELGQERNATHIIARVLEAKLFNEPFTLYGTNYETPDGTCIRDYVHVADLADAHVKAIEYLLQSGSSSMALNLGINKGISNKEIIDYVTNTFGHINVVYGPRREGDPNMLIANANAANRILNWQPNHSDLPTIINSAWKWYNNFQSA